MNSKTWKESRRFLLTAMKDFGFGKMSLETRLQEDARELVQEIAKLEGKPSNLIRVVEFSRGKCCMLFCLWQPVNLNLRLFYFDINCKRNLIKNKDIHKSHFCVVLCLYVTNFINYIKNLNAMREIQYLNLRDKNLFPFPDFPMKIQSLLKFWAY